MIKRHIKLFSTMILSSFVLYNFSIIIEANNNNLITKTDNAVETVISAEVEKGYTFPFDNTRDLSQPFLNTEPGKNLILDVDMSTDVDDVCAVRMATALDDLGVINLKAVNYCISTGSIGALRGLLVHDGKTDVLMGTGMEVRTDGSPYWHEMIKYNDNQGDVDTAVRQYRKVLAEATSPVDIVTTGQITNLAYLLRSEPDDISSLTGKELVMSKVGQLYVVGGDFPEGWSNNLALTHEARLSTKYVIQNWGLPIIFSPGNHAGKLTCGKYLQDLDVNKLDPVTRSLYAFGTSTGRTAWDPFGVWVAAYACEELNQVSLTRCTISMNDGGVNTFVEDPNGMAYILNLINPDLNYYNQVMDNHLIHIYTKVYGIENPNKHLIGLQ